MNNYIPATQPTIYFIGVTTGSSSIMKVFPKWAKALGLHDAVIKGIDFAPHSSAEEYREAVNFIKNDPLSMGALVTTHKIDLFNTCKDLFEYVDPYAEKLGEVSSISKRGDQLCAHAKDPISSGLALENFVPENYWKDYDGDVLLLEQAEAPWRCPCILRRRNSAIMFRRRSSLRTGACQGLSLPERYWKAFIPGFILNTYIIRRRQTMTGLWRA